MDLQLTGKTAVITGGSKGIGLACARALRDEGVSVVLAARDRDRLDAAAAELGGEVPTMSVDLSEDAGREALAARFGDADILVNNAGAIPGGGLFDLDMDTWRDAWALKVFGYVHLTQLFLARMKDRGSGSIVNIIGMAARLPRWSYICGAPGNAALNAFTNAVGGKSPEWGVRVTGINPPATETERIITLSKARARTDLGDESRWEEVLGPLPFDRMADPMEIGRLAAVLASPVSAYTSGTVVDVDGGGQFR